MNRTVIKIEELSEEDVRVYFRIEEPTDVADAERSRLLKCDAKKKPFSDLSSVRASERNPIPGDLVRVAGEKILEALSRHPGIREAIDRAVHAHGNDPRPIYIDTKATDAEAVPWEALFHPHGKFLSLDPRWPIARWAGQHTESALFSFEPPLRIAAVLGAAEVKALPEWNALFTEVQNAAIPCHISAFVSEAALEAKINAQANAQASLSVTVEPMPATPDALINRLEKEKPHLLHIFCHGSADWDGYLEIATRGHELGDQPLYVSNAELKRLCNTVWLITLDACEGAMPTGPVHSLAYSLVKDGIPAVIGMREPIDSMDSSLFCSEFYREALSDLAANLRSGASTELDWAPLLRSARNGLCRQNAHGPVALTAAQHKHWTLPVLYQSPVNPKIVVTDNTAAITPEEQERELGELGTLRRMRAEMHPDTPQEVLDQIDEMIETLEAGITGRAPGDDDGAS